jgi:UDP-N-acetylmuramate dehydrogenase
VTGGAAPRARPAARSAATAGRAAHRGREDTVLAAVAAELAGGTGARPRHEEPLAPHTTMRVGGPADLLFVARDRTSLAEAVKIAARAGLACLVVGRGSNLIFSDAGFRGLVVVARAEGWRIEGSRLIAEAGLPLARAATEAGRAGLSGLEFGLAIPGTVGGAVWANAGAHGSDVASVLEWATVLRSDGVEVRETAATLELTYRDSRLKHARMSDADGGQLAPQLAPLAQPGDVVLEACFALRSEEPRLIAARHAEIRRWRREHQPLNLPSAGSVFRNPPGDSAGRLIEAAGLKGRRVGGAVISEGHANFIVNDRHATARDVRELAELARTEVAGRFGVQLVYEVQFAGEWASPQEEER